MNTERVLILTHARAQCVSITRIVTVKQLHFSVISLSIFKIILLVVKSFYASGKLEENGAVLRFSSPCKYGIIGLLTAFRGHRFFCDMIKSWLDSCVWLPHTGCEGSWYLSSSWSWERRQKQTLWRWSGWPWPGARPRFSGAETGWCEPLERRGSRAPLSRWERRRYTWWWSAPVMGKRRMPWI